jgi:hypothetical protein
VHSISLLENDPEAIQTWFWNGFDLTVVDAVHPIQALYPSPLTTLNNRKVIQNDAVALAEIAAKHCQHYRQPPIFMVPHESDDATVLTCFHDTP